MPDLRKNASFAVIFAASILAGPPSQAGDITGFLSERNQGLNHYYQSLKQNPRLTDSQRQELENKYLGPTDQSIFQGSLGSIVTPQQMDASGGITQQQLNQLQSQVKQDLPSLPREYQSPDSSRLVDRIFNEQSSLIFKGATSNSLSDITSASRAARSFAEQNANSPRGSSPQNRGGNSSPQTRMAPAPNANGGEAVTNTDGTPDERGLDGTSIPRIMTFPGKKKPAPLPSDAP